MSRGALVMVLVPLDLALEIGPELDLALEIGSELPDLISQLPLGLVVKRVEGAPGLLMSLLVVSRL